MRAYETAAKTESSHKVATVATEKTKVDQRINIKELQCKVVTSKDVGDFLKWSLNENGFRYAHKAISHEVKNLQIKSGILYHEPLWPDAPYIKIFYRNRHGVVGWMVFREDMQWDHDGKVSRSLRNAFNKYSKSITPRRCDYTVKTVKDIFE